MLNLRPLDAACPIEQQLQNSATPVVLVNLFTVDEADTQALMVAWEQDANWMKQQPGFLSTQLPRPIGGSWLAMNSAVGESVEHFRADFTPIAEEIIVAKAPGPMAADPTDLHWTKLRRGTRLKPNGPVF